MDRSAIEEFTCAEDSLLAKVAKVVEAIGAGASNNLAVIYIRTDAKTAEELRRDLALLTMQRHGAKGIFRCARRMLLRLYSQRLMCLFRICTFSNVHLCRKRVYTEAAQHVAEKN
ncbi:MAG: hypothetical protein HC800_23675 [Phormidesmis sp. RL_2_1]|nr:hypothetical protein [Phormidesmis sp. RL_2_1]